MAVSRGAPPIGVTMEANLPGSCQEDGSTGCVTYLAIVAAPKPQGVRRAWVEVTTESPVNAHAPAVTQVPLGRAP